jgi:hypothetical protein
MQKCENPKIFIEIGVEEYLDIDIYCLHTDNITSAVYARNTEEGNHFFMCEGFHSRPLHNHGDEGQVMTGYISHMVIGLI